jgi:hypothetical protein
MSDEFKVVEYIRCPFCKMVFDPKGMHMDEMDGTLTCRFCERKAPFNHDERESRI